LEPRQIRIVTWIAVAIGAIMIAVACFVYVTHGEFGLGGAALTLLGVVLVGSAIWKSIDISIGKEGGISAKLVRRIEEVEANVVDVQREVRDVEVNVQGVRENVRELETIVISEASALADVPVDQVQKLRQRERRDQLRDAGDFRRALEIDRDDVISRMRLIERETARKNYTEAVNNADALKTANDSGAGFSVYPDLILSYEKTGAATQGTLLVAELDRKISDDVSNGYGYLSRAKELRWLLRDLKGVQKKLSDESVLIAVEALVHRIEATVTDLAS